MCNSQLPKGWEIKKLGEVCEIRNGGTPKTGNKEYWDGDIKWITPRDLGKLRNIYVEDTPRKISELGLQKSSAKIIPVNAIILSTRAPIGHIAINTNEMATNQGCRGLIPSNKITEQYLFYFLRGSVKLLNDLGTGATFKELSTKALASVQVPIPPLPEQQRIVKILDKAFVAIDKAKQNAEQNLRNAKEVFQSKLQSIFDNGKLKAENGEWKGTSLKDEIDLATGFAFKSKYYTNNDDDILLLRGDNIMQGDFRWKDAKRWNKSEYDNFEKYQLQENDIVLAMDRPWVNAGLKCARLSKTELPSLLVQRTARLRNKPQLNNLFLYYLIQSKGFTDYLVSIQTGIGVPHISGKQIFGFPFSKPPLKEQEQLVKKLHSLSNETKHLEEIYQQKLANLAELKKTILQKAFRGEL